MTPKLMKTLFFSFFLIVLIAGCTHREQNTAIQLAGEKERITKLIKERRLSNDSLLTLYDQSVAANDLVGQVLYSCEVGQRMRNVSNYIQAITYHQKSLIAAVALNDTLAAAQAWNHIGTDNRRLEEYAEASDCHYKALSLMDAYSDSLQTDAKMCRAAALNGIGNINTALGYYDEAEKNFREALNIEKQFDNHQGQAINYANIGRLYRYRKEYRKARSYYLLSLEQNNLEENVMGIALCNINLGEVDEEKGDFTKAMQEYAIAYRLMEQLSDRWHWLHACIPMAQIHFKQGNEAAYLRFITLAENTAREINSTSHLIRIHELKQRYHESKKDYKQALEQFRMGKALSDSVAYAIKTSSIQEARFDYERLKSQRELEKVQLQNEARQGTMRIVLISALACLLLFILLSSVLTYAYRQGRKYNKLIEETDKIRTNFFTGITHEFRTPITVIQGLNEKMSTTPELPASDRAELHHVIGEQSRQMLNLVNQLLDICKIRSGVSIPEWRHGNVVLFLRLLVDSFAPYAQAQGVSILLRNEPDPIMADFVPSYLQKIISNLVSNAVKYSFSGGTVVVSAECSKSGKHLILRVSDNGVGIDKADQSRIFDFFFRSKSTSDKQGSGVGLSFTHLLVESLRGTISVQSEPGVGSIFTIQLPLRNTSSREEILPWSPATDTIELAAAHEHTDAVCEPELAALVQEADDERPSILLVEDNKDINLLIRLLLSDRYNIHTASNGQAGFDLAVQLIPDIIITDIMMPVMDGMEMVKLLKQSPLLCHIPIIALTAMVAEQNRMEAVKSGVVTYLNKPFSPEELHLHIERLLADRDALKHYYMQHLMQTEQPEDEPRVLEDGNMQFLLAAKDTILHGIGENADFSARHLADKMCMSPSQMNRKLLSITGCSSLNYIQQIKIKQACKLLADESLSIAEVSMRSGFSDPAYFSRIFKRTMNASPSQYRQTVLAMPDVVGQQC